MSKLWLIKDKKGRIFGPYEEKDICFYIEDGKFKGEESFSSYPTGKWKPISAHPLFFEKILAQLNKKNDTSFKSEKSISIGESSVGDEDSEEEIIEPTRIVSPREVKSSKSKKQKIKIKLSKEFKEDVLADEEVSDVIEMEDIKKSFFINLKSSLKIPALLLLGLFVIAFAFLNQKGNKNTEEQIRILSVNKKREALTVSDLKVKFEKALDFYRKGTVSNYLNSQWQYIQILEGNPEQIEVYHYLCLTYLELWPFAYKDTKDKTALNRTLSLISKGDKTGVYSGVCESVKAFIEKKPEKSLYIIESIVGKMKELNLPLGFVFYIQAKAYKALKRKKEAYSFSQSASIILPKWTAPYLLRAKIYYEDRKYDLSVKEYQKILSIFPEHTSASLMLGVLEYKYLKKFKQSEKRLKSILMKSGDIVEPDILIEAYIILASIYLKQNNKKEALKYSNKAYALDPEHPNVVILKNKMGKANFEKTKVKVWGLIYKGDLLFDQGKYLKARKYFEKAYKADNKKNGLAALRVAECYWQSGASGQAIKWLRRSINTDSNILEAYFLLSAYLSELYEFESAREILKAVKNQNPSNYDLFKAYALLFFHQKKYKASIAYATRSLKFYTFDTEIYILLSKSHRAIGEGHKAFSYAEKAIEQNPNNIQAQIVYALALDLAKGFYGAKKRFEKLIQEFPQIVEYSQALGEYYFEKNLYDEALPLFLNIVEKNSKFKPAYIYLGRVYSELSYSVGDPSVKRNRYDQALKYFLSASLLDTSDPNPIFYSGQAHLQYKQYQLAENEFEKILEINSNYPLIHYYIGLVNFYQQGDENFKKALKSVKIESTKNPNYFLSYKLAGDIYRLKSKGVFNDSQEQRATYELCVKEYQKALKYVKQDIETSVGLIECYKGTGDIDTALHLAKQLIKLEGLSGYPELYKEIGSIYESKDQYENAKEYYYDYFRLNPGAKDRTKIESRILKLIDDKQQISKPKE